jgi:hypothetical protein
MQVIFVSSPTGLLWSGLESLRPLLDNALVFVDDFFGDIFGQTLGLQTLVEKYNVHNVVAVSSPALYAFELGVFVACLHLLKVMQISNNCVF